MATTSTTQTISLRASPAGYALRSGCAAVACLVLGESLHLAHTNLAVWTTHMVLNQYEYTSFQKGVERVVGRGLGIFVGLMLTVLFRNALYVGFLFQCLALMVFFYIHFSKRLAYTFLNAGLYLAVTMQIGRMEPLEVFPQGKEMFIAIAVGVIVADLVSWFGGAEHDLTIHTEGMPLLPLDPVRLGQCAMLVATVIVSQALVAYFDLPTSTTFISVMLLTIVPDVHQMLWKGGLRMLGALLAMAYAFLSLVFLMRLQHFLLLSVLLFLGSYLATYLARTGGSWAYAGVQMGLVLPMILVVPPSEFGTLVPAETRMEGVAIALGSALAVGLVAAVLFRPSQSVAS